MAPLSLSGCKDRCFFIFPQIFSYFSIKKSKYLIFLLYLCNTKSGCSAVGSALRSGRRGRAFESPHPDLIGNSTLIRQCFIPFFFLSTTAKAHILVFQIRFQPSDCLFRKFFHQPQLLNTLQRTMEPMIVYNGLCLVEIDIWMATKLIDCQFVDIQFLQ